MNTELGTRSHSTPRAEARPGSTAVPAAKGDDGPDLGDRVAAVRRSRGLSLRALASAAGVSSSFLSQLENGRTNASVSSLRKVAAALGLTPAQLLDDGVTHTAGVLRAEDRPTIPLDGGIKYVLSLPPLRQLEVYAGTFEPGASTGPDHYVHGASQEMFVVTAGSVVLTLDGTDYTMRKGDSIEYMSNVPHRVANPFEQGAEVLWINSPPTPDETVADPTGPSR
ncbi:helix-turn-helix domain-containing protein [Leucobacter edaphi]|uniref:helix-turn-helix domain-containing protein n=1 Tax=Leucobacter edaphi TaxID=2796472 RepID=UPI0034E276AF